MSANVDISQFVRSLNAQAKPRVMEAGRQAVDAAGEHILGQAQKLAPIKSGDLKGSATGEKAQIRGNNITKTIGFSVHYAAAVHERLDLHHDQGQAKFLETALRQNQVRFSQYVVAAMKKAL